MLKMNPTTGKMDVVNSRKLVEYTTDPITATAGDNWILRRARIGQPIGLLLALTYAEDGYFFSYKTQSGSIKRSEMK